MNGHLLLIRILKGVGQPHQVHQFLICPDLNAKSFRFQSFDLEIIEFIFFNQYVVDRFDGMARFAIVGVYYFQFDIGQPLVYEAEFFGRGFRQVDNSIFYIGATVIDHYFNRLVVTEVGNPDAGAEGKGGRGVCARRESPARRRPGLGRA